MTRLSLLLPLTALATGALLAASPAQAARGEGHYSVTLEQALEAPRQEIIKGKVWKCQGDRCIGQISGSRAELTCKRVAGEFGKVARFAGPKGELSAEELAACNAG
ncbi:MAG: hypothetical protein R3D89_09370 [Sphingomonadaceae bacterium]